VPLKKRWKKLLVFTLPVFVMPAITAAESEYEKWKKQEMGSYQSFKDERDKAFTSFLKKQWKEYKLYSGEKLFEKPKPIKLPVAPLEDTSPIKGKVVARIPAPAAIPFKPAPEVKPLHEKKKGMLLGINFYGKEAEFYYDKKLKVSLGSRIDRKAISKSWEALSLADYDGLLVQTRDFKHETRLNDWGFHRLLYRVGEGIYGKNQDNNISIFVWFMLSKADYEAKVAYNDDKVFLLLPSKNKIFAAPYLTIGGKRFYAISVDGKKKKLGSLYTYQGKYPGANQPMDYNINVTPAIKTKVVNKNLSFKYRGKTHDLHIEYNTLIPAFFEHYPQTEFEVYFDASVSEEAGKSLTKALKPLVEGKSEGEAVNLIMRFVQTAFKYKTDDKQFGREKYLLPEETLFYPFSDCEDRSILFAYLVKNLTGLEVVGLHYPNHMATAVRFSDDIKGDAVMHNGKRYIVCDPTYVNADIGKAMPQFKGVKPKIIVLNL